MRVTNQYKCRGCDSSNTKCLGILPIQTHFAGKLIGRSMPESHLYKCSSCFMLARYPILSENEYNELYADGSSKFWSDQNIELRPDQKLVKDLVLKKIKNNFKILDVGCYTGDFLSSLPEQYLKYGVEMSKEASIISSNRGIQIIGNDLYDIKTTEKFDLIIAIDVIEHTSNPEEFLQKLVTMLSEGGGIVISTGNSDSWLWKIVKNNFWYSFYPEHISFIGEKWLKKICTKNNLTITDKHFFHYFPMDLRRYIKNFGKAILCLLRMDPIRYSNSTKDHFCFVLKTKT